MTDRYLEFKKAAEGYKVVDLWKVCHEINMEPAEGCSYLRELCIRGIVNADGTWRV